jgi:hypothetical protein
MTENNCEKRFADCERVIRELEETNNPQERISLLREMRQLIQSIEEFQNNKAD